MVQHRRRPLGLEAPAKVHLAQHIASVVALSLQHNCATRGNGEVSGGKLASTLRLAEQNVADMTAFLRRKEAARDKTQEKVGVEKEKHTVCVICLDDMTESLREVEALPCGHVFHSPCIAEWLLYRRVCPVDRQPVN